MENRDFVKDEIAVGTKDGIFEEPNDDAVHDIKNVDSSAR